jgi:hypothetical protein
MIEIIKKKNNEIAEEKLYQKELKEKGEEHVRIELETDNLIIYVPTNEDGSKYYGRNTKWCTTGKEENMFDYYNGMGPLYIIQSKSDPKIKYQLHIDSRQLMNSSDIPIHVDVLNTVFNDTNLKEWLLKKKRLILKKNQKIIL